MRSHIDLRNETRLEASLIQETEELQRKLVVRMKERKRLFSHIDHKARKLGEGVMAIRMHHGVKSPDGQKLAEDIEALRHEPPDTE